MDSYFLKIVAVVILMAALRQVYKSAYDLARKDSSARFSIVFSVLVAVLTIWSAYYLGVRI